LQGRLNILSKIQESLTNNHQSIKPEDHIAFAKRPDLKSDEYKIFLVKRYCIEKNVALGKYIVKNRLFDDIKNSLEYADSPEFNVLRDNLKTAYIIRILSAKSTAEKNNLKQGDIIISYNNSYIRSEDDIKSAINTNTSPTAAITLIRNGELIELVAKSGTLGLQGETYQLDNNSIEKRLALLRSH
jgi:hypothetical protein